MRNKLIKFLVLTIKFTIVFFVVRFGLSKIDTQLPFYEQHFLVWGLLYLPYFMGFEAIITLILNSKYLEPHKGGLPRFESPPPPPMKN